MSLSRRLGKVIRSDESLLIVWVIYYDSCILLIGRGHIVFSWLYNIKIKNLFLSDLSSLEYIFRQIKNLFSSNQFMVFKSDFWLFWAQKIEFFLHRFFIGDRDESIKVQLRSRRTELSDWSNRLPWVIHARLRKVLGKKKKPQITHLQSSEF